MKLNRFFFAFFFIFP
ncbi:hypothetical protein YV76_001442 [Salmonella enterica subsp. enterica]|nr:hypothetical protein [Salmonella enterica subsp. enterica]